MSRVEWSRTAADDVEAVLSIMLCRENPNAQRIRPGRGDGGIDVYIPDEQSKWVVYQVKSFTGALQDSHKRQITKSWNSFLTNVAANHVDVAAWYLLRPADPTPGDLTWLETLTKGAAFPCEWRGLTYCDRLAADNPSVVDYYLHDGKDRLIAAIKDMMEAVAWDKAVIDEPAKSTQTLEAIYHTINSVDPHYRYDFRVEQREFDADGELPRPSMIDDGSGMLAAMTNVRPDGLAVTFRVFARFREAIVERPIPGAFTLVAEPGSTQAEAIKDFYEYGLPITAIEAKNVELDLPGGLGLTGPQEGTVFLGPAQLTTAKPLKLQFVVLEGDSDVVVAVADLNMGPATQGMVENKFALSGNEVNGVFEAVLRFDGGGGRLNFTITTGNYTGLDPSDVLPALYMLSMLAPPHRLDLRLRNGPSIGEPSPLPYALIEIPNEIIQICEALATIQAESYAPIVIPDFTDTSKAQAYEWLEAARLLRGELIPFTWNHIDIVPNDGAEMARDAFMIATESPLVTTIGDVAINLGFKLVHLEAARVGEDQSEVPPGHVRLVPAASDKGSIRWQKTSFLPPAVSIKS